MVVQIFPLSLHCKTKATIMKITREQSGVYNAKGNNDYTIVKLEGHSEWTIFTAVNLDACDCGNNWGVGASTKKEAVLWVQEEDLKLN